MFAIHAQSLLGIYYTFISRQLKKILSTYTDYLGEVFTPTFYVIFLEVGYILLKKKNYLISSIT